jgi:hypothetical protein
MQDVDPERVRIFIDAIHTHSRIYHPTVTE